MKYRRAEALFHYAIIITVVAIALAAMHTYLRRGIQAKVKDLTDHIICDRQLASLSDPATEKSTKDINSTYNLQKDDGAGGMSNVNTTSAYTVQMIHEAESLDTIDYGRGVTGVINPLATYSSYSESQEARDSVEAIDELGASIDEANDDNSDGDSDAGSDYGSAASSLSDNISESGTDSSGRGSAGGKMSYYNEGSE